MKTLLERFEEKYIPLTESGCWIWLASGLKQGYGRINVNGKKVLAHRLSYQLYKGAVSSKICVLHKYDIPSCVNPDHLYLGTQADNMIDCAEKGRHSKVDGSKNPASKLTEKDIPVIRQRLKNGETQLTIAKDYGINRSKISSIKLGCTWGHVA